MKKTVKNLFLVMVMAVLLFGLTACGDNDSSKKDEKNKEESKANVLVATKKGEDNFYGEYTETYEITFKDDKADKIVMTRELESEEKAENIAKVLEYLDESELQGMKIERDGNKIIITLDSEAFAAEEDVEEDELTKESLKKKLEDEGYTVK